MADIHGYTEILWQEKNIQLSSVQNPSIIPLNPGLSRFSYFIIITKISWHNPQPTSTNHHLPSGNLT